MLQKYVEKNFEPLVITAIDINEAYETLRTGFFDVYLILLLILIIIIQIFETMAELCLLVLKAGGKLKSDANQ